MLFKVKMVLKRELFSVESNEKDAGLKHLFHIQLCLVNKVSFHEKLDLKKNKAS